MEKLSEFLKHSYGQAHLNDLQIAYQLQQQIKQLFAQDVVIVFKKKQVRIYCPNNNCAYALKLQKYKLLSLIERSIHRPLQANELVVAVQRNISS